MYSTLSTFNTTTEVALSKAPNPQLHKWLPTALGVCVCVFVRVHGVCVFTAVCSCECVFTAVCVCVCSFVWVCVHCCVCVCSRCVCVFTAVFLCVCVCDCVCMFMWFMRTQICIMTWVWHRYYKEKVIYEDIFSVPIILNAYKSYRVSFFGGK